MIGSSTGAKSRRVSNTSVDVDSLSDESNASITPRSLDRKAAPKKAAKKEQTVIDLIDSPPRKGDRSASPISLSSDDSDSDESLYLNETPVQQPQTPGPRSGMGQVRSSISTEPQDISSQSSQTAVEEHLLGVESSNDNSSAGNSHTTASRGKGQKFRRIVSIPSPSGYSSQSPIISPVAPQRPRALPPLKIEPVISGSSSSSSITASTKYTRRSLNEEADPVTLSLEPALKSPPAPTQYDTGPGPEPLPDITAASFTQGPLDESQSSRSATHNPEEAPERSKKRPHRALSPSIPSPSATQSSSSRSTSLSQRPRPVPLSQRTSRSSDYFIASPKPSQLSRMQSSSDIEQMLDISGNESTDEEDETRYSKRRRTIGPYESDHTPTPSKYSSTPQKHSDHWHPDGSVVVKIENTIFCLFRSRLMQLSSYFKRRLQENDDAGEATLEGELPLESYEHRMPLLTLDNVSIIDFSRLLDAVDAAFDFVYNPPSFHILASILRASRALSFDKLDAFATDHLRKMWSSSLADVSERSITHAPETVILGRRCGLSDILKRSLYELVRTKGLGQVVEHADDQDIDGMDADDRENREISREDLVLLISTREKLCHEWYLAADSPSSLQSTPCPLSSGGAAEDGDTKLKREQCQKAFHKRLSLWSTHVKSGLYEDFMYDPICGLERLCKVDWESMGICSGCVQHWRDALQKKRENIWDNLDVWFGLK